MPELSFSLFNQNVTVTCSLACVILEARLCLTCWGCSVPQVCDGGDPEGSHRSQACTVPSAQRGACRFWQRALRARVCPLCPTSPVASNFTRYVQITLSSRQNALHVPFFVEPLTLEYLANNNDLFLCCLNSIMECSSIKPCVYLIICCSISSIP